jgi:segregation and condensation protein B
VGITGVAIEQFGAASGNGWKQARSRQQPGAVPSAASAYRLSHSGDLQDGEPRESNESSSPGLPQAAPISPLRMVEAILLIAREPISARKLALLAELDDATQARSLARQLNEIYDLRGHAFRIEEVAGGMQLLTRPQFATWLRRLEHVRGEEVLSSGMLECLSIVAYRQPVMRAEIEAIRGVGCDEVLRQLMQRDLVRIAGRHEELGRPYLYGTTKRFLQLFGLQSLDYLPRAQKIRQAEAEIATRLRNDGERTTDTIPEEQISDASFDD